MDNLGTGGNRVDTGENSPEVFGEKVEKTQEKLDLSGEAKTELGSRAAEMFGTPKMPEDLSQIEALEKLPDFPEMMPPEIATPEADTEFRPLAEDGSTEGKIDKSKILTFGGDLIDKESQKQVEKALSKYKNDPFELDNIRNKMMAEGLRDNYGRIFGNDDDDDEASSSENILTAPEKNPTEVVEFSEMMEGKVA